MMLAVIAAALCAMPSDVNERCDGNKLRWSENRT
jgi:hypothetical protein